MAAAVIGTCQGCGPCRLDSEGCCTRCGGFAAENTDAANQKLSDTPIARSSVARSWPGIPSGRGETSMVGLFKWNAAPAVTESDEGPLTAAEAVARRDSIRAELAETKDVTLLSLKQKEELQRLDAQIKRLQAQERTAARLKVAEERRAAVRACRPLVERMKELLTEALQISAEMDRVPGLPFVPGLPSRLSWVRTTGDTPLKRWLAEVASFDWENAALAPGTFVEVTGDTAEIRANVDFTTPIVRHLRPGEEINLRASSAVQFVDDGVAEFTRVDRDGCAKHEKSGGIRVRITKPCELDPESTPVKKGTHLRLPPDQARSLVEGGLATQIEAGR